MKKEHAAYIAGIIDGEGSISLVKVHKNQYPSPFISIPSSDLELLEWIKNTTGYGTIIRKRNYNPARHKDSYTLNIRYNEAITLLNDIVEYLVLPRKKRRAMLIISEYKKVTPRNGRYSKELLAEKERFYQKFNSI
ncbi:MAG: hypothetical protein HPY58_05490 [Firmicutes bacterium]|nr:hypothetical protein [Bacillota bacterium]